MLGRLSEDVAAVKRRDPAARDTLDVLLCYPGMHALWLYRLAHALWNRGFRLAARVLSTLVRLVTGVEIHPAAEIGRRCVIDHGAGVVIGETAEIGDDVLMYHGCTLGGDANHRGKRHPTIGNDVVLGANATLIGAISVGDGAAVGAGSVVVSPSPRGRPSPATPLHRSTPTPDHSTNPRAMTFLWTGSFLSKAFGTPPGMPRTSHIRQPPFTPTVRGRSRSSGSGSCPRRSS